MRKQLAVVMSGLVLVGCWAGIINAGESGHYPLGSEGIKAATLPPPGWYLKTYTTYYHSNLFKDGAGNNSGLGLDLDALAIAPRLLWMTGQKFLGADYGMDVLIPLVYTDFELDAAGIDDHEFCMGDMLLEPVDLGWHGDRWDIGAAVGLWFPTGKYDKNHPASPGKDFWTTMFTLGGTYYFDQEKTWSSSILGRYEINCEKDETDVQPGQDILFEWGLGKTLAKVWEVGVIGYCEWQLTDDRGSDVTWDPDVHDRVAGIGPELGLAIPSANMFVSLRSAWEFSAVDRPEGTTVTLTVTKRF